MFLQWGLEHKEKIVLRKLLYDLLSWNVNFQVIRNMCIKVKTCMVSITIVWADIQLFSYCLFLPLCSRNIHILVQESWKRPSLIRLYSHIFISLPAWTCVYVLLSQWCWLASQWLYCMLSSHVIPLCSWTRYELSFLWVTFDFGSHFWGTDNLILNKFQSSKILSFFLSPRNDRPNYTLQIRIPISTIHIELKQVLIILDNHLLTEPNSDISELWIQVLNVQFVGFHLHRSLCVTCEVKMLSRIPHYGKQLYKYVLL